MNAASCKRRQCGPPRVRSGTYRCPCLISKVRSRRSRRNGIALVPTMVILSRVCPTAREHKQSLSTTETRVLTLSGKVNAPGGLLAHGLRGRLRSRMIARGQLPPCARPVHRSHWERSQPSTLGEKGSSVAPKCPDHMSGSCRSAD